MKKVYSGFDLVTSSEMPNTGASQLVLGGGRGEALADHNNVGIATFKKQQS